MPKKGKPTKTAATKAPKAKRIRPAKAKSEPSFYVVFEPPSVRIVDQRPRSGRTTAEYKSFAEAKDEALDRLIDMIEDSETQMWAMKRAQSYDEYQALSPPN